MQCQNAVINSGGEGDVLSQLLLIDSDSVAEKPRKNSRCVQSSARKTKEFARAEQTTFPYQSLALFSNRTIRHCDDRATLPHFPIPFVLAALMAQEIRRWVSPGGEEETKRAQTQRTFSNQLMTAVKSKVLYLRSTFCADELEVGEGLRIRGGGDLPVEPGEDFEGLGGGR
jgi:hypothetical protein